MLGKGIFVYTSTQFYNGDIGKFLNHVGKLKLNHIFLRIGGCVSAGTSSFPERMPTVVKELRANFPSMQIWGWHYIYGGAWMDKYGGIHYTNIATPEQEAAFAKDWTKKLGLDGYVINAEREFKFGLELSGSLNNNKRAERFMKAINGIGVPIGLSTYRYPTLHREYSWRGFFNSNLINYAMPQVYWGKYANAPKLELMRSVAEWKNMIKLPFVPAGRAYIGDGHPDPTREEITQFNQTVKEMKLDGCNYWAFDYLVRHPGGALWSLAIEDFVWDGQVTVPEIPTIPESKPYKVLGYYLRVREGPGLQYKFVRWLKPNQEIDVYEKRYDNYVWGRIDATKSLWCALNYATPM